LNNPLLQQLCFNNLFFFNFFNFFNNQLFSTTNFFQQPTFFNNQSFSNQRLCFTPWHQVPPPVVKVPKLAKAAKSLVNPNTAFGMNDVDLGTSLLYLLVVLVVSLPVPTTL